MVEQLATIDTAATSTNLPGCDISAARRACPQQSAFIKHAFSSKTWNKRRGKQHATFELTNRSQVKWGST
jgi:hypothetical protein